MKKLIIKIPLYELQCTVIVADNIEVVINKYIKSKKWHKDFLLKEDENVYGYTIPVGNLKDYCTFLCKQNVTINCITHEVSHIVDFILMDRGFDNPGEAKAYLTGYINEKIFDYVLKNGLLKHKYIIYPDNKPIDKEDEKSGLL